MSVLKCLPVAFVIAASAAFAQDTTQEKGDIPLDAKQRQQQSAPETIKRLLKCWKVEDAVYRLDYICGDPAVPSGFVDRRNKATSGIYRCIPTAEFDLFIGQRGEASAVIFVDSDNLENK